MTDSKTMRVSTDPLARARKAFDALLSSRQLNYLVSPDGRLGLDRRVSDLPGSAGLVRLLVDHIAAVNRRGHRLPPPATPLVGDRQLVDGALLALVEVLEEAARRVAGDAEE